MSFNPPSHSPILNTDLTTHPSALHVPPHKCTYTTQNFGDFIWPLSKKRQRKEKTQRKKETHTHIFSIFVRFCPKYFVFHSLLLLFVCVFDQDAVLAISTGERFFPFNIASAPRTSPCRSCKYRRHLRASLLSGSNDSA